MSNFWYGPGVKSICDGLVLPSVDLLAVLVDETSVGAYVPDAAHEFYDEIPTVARIAVSDPIPDVEWLYDGVLSIPALVTFANVTGTDVQGDSICIVVSDVGGDTTSQLILHIDDLGGIPVFPNGTDVDWVPNTGPDGVGRI